MDIEETIYKYRKQKKTFLVATVVKTSGSTPTKIGSKIIINKNGLLAGTIGGGILEKKVIDEGIILLKRSQNKLKEYDLSNEISANSERTNMLCGGKVTVFFECNIPKSYLYIFGGGHIAQALLKIIDKQRFEVVIIDNRKEYAVKEVQKKADRVILSDFDEYSKQFKPSDSSFAVIITHGHNRDYEVLKNIYKRRLKFKYVGMIGSTKKVFLEIKRLKAELGDVDLSNLYSPVGLSIGGKSPYEIALSIAAEIQSVIYNKNNIHNMLDYKEI